MNTVVTFGEIMGRLTPGGFRRLRQAMPGQLEFIFAGAEANVAVSISQLGGKARFVTALPGNPIAEACLGNLGGFGIDTDHVVRCREGRLGLFFVECGANQRPSNVVYDRERSSISVVPAESYKWAEAFQGANWFHVTGITPAISAKAARATLASVQAAKDRKLTVSCDLNFRKKLWRWEPGADPAGLAQKTMREILPFVDVVIANEEDAAIVLNIHASATDVDSGQVAADKYPDVAREIVRQFTNVSRVGVTLRESISASHNRWGGMLYDAKEDESFFAPMAGAQYKPYEIANIVDRVGAGDAFAAGLIFASMTEELSDPSDVVRFAVASSCLAHSIEGDFNLSSRADVESLMRGSGAGRVVR